MSDSEQNSMGSTIVAGLIGGGIAAAINLVIYFIVGPLNVAQAGGPIAPITLIPILIASIVAAIFAAVFLWLLRRFTGNGTRIFQIVGVIFLLLSLAGPLTSAETTGIALSLSLMHVVTGGAIIWSLTMR
ncbi:MAG: hypothetical protein ACI9EW_001263 [Cellvibrionaceae bacterium]|jgi:hypothetical protein